ncbi:MAG: 23S rRNA (uracil(1939)-C(5))-methyltransferase RlmD [Thermotogota bacterium]
MVQDKSMKEHDIKHDIIIEKFLNGGQGLGHDSSGKPVFVTGAYPGEIVDVEINKEKKNFDMGKVHTYKYKIPQRNQPVCKVFRDCGGCDWLDLDYSFQLKSKKDIIHEQFMRLGNIDTTGILQDVLPSQPVYQTRNKMTYACGFLKGKLVLGLRTKGSNRIVEPLGCKVVDPQFEHIRKTVQIIFNDIFTPEDLFQTRKRLGFLRGISIRKTEYTGQFMLILITSLKMTKQLKQLKARLKEELPFLDSIINVFTRKKSMLSGEYATVYGSGTLREHIDWFDYNIPPTAFFQTNTKMLKVFLDTVKEMAQPNKNEMMMDLYGGVGFFSIYLSPLYKRVILVESQPESAKAARANCSMNKITNVEIIEKSVEAFLEPAKYIDQPDTLIIDPPRAGIEKDALEHIIEIQPKKIVYCSCDLGTLIRDCSRLVEAGYIIETIQPMDNFPHTAHVENICLLKKK